MDVEHSDGGESGRRRLARYLWYLLERRRRNVGGGDAPPLEALRPTDESNRHQAVRSRRDEFDWQLLACE